MQFANAKPSIYVRLSGSAISVSAVQLSKALNPMLVRLSGSVISDSDVQPSKAYCSISVTPSGMVMLVSDVRFWKALYPMLVTFLPSISAGISNTVSLPIYLLIFTVPSSCNSVIRQASSVKPLLAAYRCPAVFFM